MVDNYDSGLCKLAASMTDEYTHRSLTYLRYMDGDVTLSQFNKNPGKPQRSLSLLEEQYRAVLVGIQDYLRRTEGQESFDILYSEIIKLTPDLRNYDRKCLDQTCRGETTRLWRQEKFKETVLKLVFGSSISDGLQ